ADGFPDVAVVREDHDTVLILLNAGGGAAPGPGGRGAGSGRGTAGKPGGGGPPRPGRVGSAGARATQRPPRPRPPAPPGECRARVRMTGADPRADSDLEPDDFQPGCVPMALQLPLRVSARPRTLPPSPRKT